VLLIEIADLVGSSNLSGLHRDKTRTCFKHEKPLLRYSERVFQFTLNFTEGEGLELNDYLDQFKVTYSNQIACHLKEIRTYSKYEKARLISQMGFFVLVREDGEPIRTPSALQHH
jgi:hypothetical protein